VSGGEFATAAVDLAENGWAVFPLSGKHPLLRCPITIELERAGSTERCPGGCGNDGHGVKDATSDPAKIAAWWSDHPRANIGARVDDRLFVLDTDPRHGGEVAVEGLQAENGSLPDTLVAFSGRDDGGRHRYFLHPGGQLSDRRLPKGVDIKTKTGYVVLPPSVHPATGIAYRWLDPHIVPAAAPGWLLRLLRPERVVVPTVRSAWSRPDYSGESIADWYCANHSWADVLTGWTLVLGDGDSNGSAWRHPTATSKASATIKNGCLFVYSPNTVFEVTELERPRGYTKFRAYALLCHGGDLSAAAGTARDLRGENDRSLSWIKRDRIIRELFDSGGAA
jgi:hypothetical protein